MTSYDSASFSAGQDAGARTSACVARLAALELVESSHWWNRWRRRLMARALVTCAEELESSADASGPDASVPPDDGSHSRGDRRTGPPGSLDRR